MAIRIKYGNNYREINLGDVLFLDVETVPLHPQFGEMPPHYQELWRDKSRKYSYESKPPEDLYFDKAGIHAEFGKIVCISVGAYKKDKDSNKMQLRLKSYYGHDEKALLGDFKLLMDKNYNDTARHILCGHNAIEFDFPYIARRMLINEVPLPTLLNVQGTKSWDNKWLIDTMELWRFGDYKEKTSLNLLAACFNIPSPKDDISGKDVAKVYHQDNDLERIMIYCQKDIVTLFRLFQRFSSVPMIADEDVVYA